MVKSGLLCPLPVLSSYYFDNGYYFLFIGWSVGWLVIYKYCFYISFFYRLCFFTVESASFKSKFMTQINASFGSGGMTLALNESQFALFFQFLKEDVSTIPIVQAVGDKWTVCGYLIKQHR